MIVNLKGEIKAMFYKVKEINPLPEYNLLVAFESGECKQYNVAALFNRYIVFGVLTITKGLFEQVKVDVGGYGISWNDDIDSSCNELYGNGIQLIQENNPLFDEIEAITAARKEYGRGETVSHDDINWDLKIQCNLKRHFRYPAECLFLSLYIKFSCLYALSHVIILSACVISAVVACFLKGGLL